jgi:hypothetical protein
MRLSGIAERKYVRLYGKSQLNLSMLSEYAIILIVSIAITMLIYDFIIRWFGPIRLMFGMRPKK